MSGVGVLLVECEELDSLGDAVVLWGAMLGSTVDTYSAPVFGLSHIFYVEVDSN